MNLDAGLSNRDASDGYRCQYSDPDNPNSNHYNNSGPCVLGRDSAQADAYHWRTDDSRSFSGLRSLHWGVELAAGVYTTPQQTLEAIATTEPINIGPGGACSITIARSCLSDTDCPAGERCGAAVPELTFKHQISLYDDRWDFNVPGGFTADRAIVQIQLADADGTPLGHWQKIDPWWNRYDSRNINGASDCSFDPIDDGNDEDDLFEGALRAGPSSTCYPELTFASAGDTDDPFDPDNLNGPAEGPGLKGAIGPGTWVESRFSLDRFRGRRVRIRFLTTSMEIATNSSGYWREADLPHNDGWWIDDVTVTHTLVDPVTLATDDKINTTLGIDGDGDCAADTLDCRPGDAGYWAKPGEVTELRASHSGGVGGTTTLSWGPPATLGGTAVDFVMIVRDGATCVESDVGATRRTTHAVSPAPGQVLEFLIQAENPCGRGSLGTASSNIPRNDCF